MVFILLMHLTFNSATAGDSSAIAIAKGVYAPFFKDLNETDQEVGPLYVDKYPVTNREYLEFVKKNSQWRRSKIKMLYASSDYLAHWKSDTVVPAALLDQPVTNVSWFSAREFCKSKRKRLLRTAEWEYVSDAQDKENLELILKWYGETGGDLKSVKNAQVNALGVVGMHGLIWEWVDDFASAIMSSDSRSSNETSKSMFCGSGSIRAKDPSQYATFMRFAHRSSLKANSVGRTLGFRCAADMELKGN